MQKFQSNSYVTFIILKMMNGVQKEGLVNLRQEVHQKKNWDY